MRKAVSFRIEPALCSPEKPVGSRKDIWEVEEELDTAGSSEGNRAGNFNKHHERIRDRSHFF